MKVVGLLGALNWKANEFDEPNTYVHDAGATLFVNGEHIRSINEERLTRVKDDGSFPRKSIDYVLGDEYKKEDIDIVCYAPAYVDIAQQQLVNQTASKMMREVFPNAEVWMVSHHLCHAASAVFTAPFNSGSFVTLDGLGSGMWDFATGAVRFGENNSIGYFDKEKNIFRFFRGTSEQGMNSFGEYYCNMSRYIYDQKHREIQKMKSSLRGEVFDNIVFATDFDNTPKEGKIMGLSSYGQDLGQYSPACLSTEYPKEQFGIDKWEFGLPEVHFYDYEMIWRYLEGTAEDKSFYVQKNFEQAMMYWVTEMQKAGYLEENNCFAGGCFLNVCANTLLRPLFKNMHIPPFTNDSGIHFGAAAWGSFKSKQTITVPENIALMGKEYNDKEIEDVIGFKGAKNVGEIKYKKYEDFDELCEVVAGYLEDNKIIGWMQGRSEYGPRALGSRSLLMSPRDKKNKDIMNDRVKHREYWRPFAGVMLEEDVGEYFDPGFSTPYMLYAQTSTTKKIPAITHADKSCRIQTVNDTQNARMCQLLRKLDVPILLNTSFNRSGDPIVETPQDALDSFMKMDIDYLVIGNYLISKWN